MGKGSFRPTVASIVAGATFVAYAGLSVLPTPARAADAETTSVLALLDGLQSYVPGLANVGALGEPIPTLGVKPGSPGALGLGDLMTQVRSLVNTAGLSAAATTADVVSAINGAHGSVGSGRTAALTATSPTAGDIEVTLHVTRTLASSSLDIAGKTPIGPGYPPFRLSTTGGVKVDLSLDLGVGLHYVAGGSAPGWITPPTLSLGATAHFATPINVPTGLGVLGAQLASDSTLDLQAGLTTTFSDPNNDGRLYFDEPGGASSTDGELSAPGAGAGLVTAALSTGTVNASLHVQATPSSAITLPGVDAVVTVTGDLPTNAINVSFASGAFDSVRGFLTMSPRDLAQGIASAASTVLGLQNAAGVKLPFMRGDYANAIGAVQRLTDFLAAAVPPATGNDPTPGLPSFTSVQGLLEQLNALTGDDTVTIPNATYDAATRKVRFQINIVRDTSAGSLALDPPGAAISGPSATYTDTSLTDSSQPSDFSAALVGRQVVAGTGTGLIESVSGKTLTLSDDPVTPQGGTPPVPDVRWVGGKPADGTAYSILAADPKTGAVELGNALKANGNGAITNANSKLAQAQVTPGFELHLPIVLDLRDPDTSDCDPGPGTAPCPYSSTVNGVTQIISSLPVVADRVKLAIDGFSLSADADISTAVDADATVGFLGVKVKGTLKACTVSAAVDATCTGTRAPGDHLLTLGLAAPSAFPSADAQGDIPFRALVGDLTTAISGGHVSDVLDVAVHGQAYADLQVEVPGATTFFGGAPSAGVKVTLPDLSHPDAFTVTPTASIGSLGSFNLDPNNPSALFAAILADLQQLQSVVGHLPGAGALDSPIPLVGKSFNEVVGSGAAGNAAFTSVAAAPPAPAMTVLDDTTKTFDSSYVGRTVHVGSQQARVASVDPAHPTRLVLKPALSPLPPSGSAYTTDSELQGVISTLQDASSPNLQTLLTTVADHLGLGSTAGFEVVPGPTDALKIKLDWKRAYSTQSPLSLNFQFPSGTDRSLIGAAGSGVITTSVTGEVKLSLLIPLDSSTVTDPTGSVKVDPADTLVKAGVTVNGDGIRFSTNLGPFKATLGDPEPADAGTELRAGLGVSIAGSSGSPVALSDLLDTVTTTVTGAGASCAGAPAGVDLALCAKFPMRINGTPAGSDPDHSNVVVRLPLNTSDLADTLDPLGPQVDGHDRVELPDNLAGTLASAALNLVSFGDGLAGYLQFAENALRASSFDGKLPLVGKDLQAGSEFIGGIRTKLQTLFAGSVPTDTNAGAIRTFVKTQLKANLPTVSNAIGIDVTCATPLEAAPAPTVTSNAGDGSTTYSYKIAAYTLVSGDKKATVTGPASADATNSAVSALDGTNNLHLQWGGVSRATGYYVLRSVNGGDYFQIADVATPEYTDQGAPDAAAAYVDVPLSQAPCADSTPAEEVTGFTVTVSLGQGKPTAAGCESDPSLPVAQRDCLGGTIPVDFGIPGLSLHSTDATQGISAKVGWRLDLKLVFDRTTGFYVDTQEGGDPEFRVGLAVTVPTPPAELNAQLAFLNITAKDNDASKPEFGGMFTIDLHDPDGKLTLDDLISPDVVDHVSAKLTADVDLDLHLTASVGSGAALPGIQADFLMTWHWSSDAPSDIGQLDIAFNNVRLDAGEFLGSVIRPVVEQVVKVFKPVQPVIDTLYEKIPVLSDLAEAVGGDPITIASLAQTFSTLAGGPDLQPFLDVLKNIRDLVKSLDGDCGGAPAPCINVGSFSLVTAKAVSEDVNPSTAQGVIDTGAPSYSKNDNLKADLNAKSTAAIDKSGADAAHPGFSFPFLDHPEKIFGLMVGQDVDLVKFDSGPLTLGFDFQESFGPVYAPPPVNIVVGGGASVTMRIVAGFDTYGIRTAIEKGKVDAGILDSLFFYTTDDNGKPIPVVKFEGYLQAGASVSLVVVEVGVVGGVKLTINFYWNDPNNDGKFRFSEFLAAALNNPICLFNVGGELSVFIKVFVTLGISPFSVSFDFELVNVVLIDFNLKPNCTPPPPKLGGVSAGTLYLFAGKFGDKAHRAPGFSGDYPFTNNGGAAEEKWVIRQYKAVPAKPAVVADPAHGVLAQPAKSAEPAKIVVTALGITETFPDPGGTTLHNVVLDSDPTATGKLSVTFNGGDKDTPFSKNVVVRTGSGDDAIRTGIGSAVVDAGPGKDQVTTLERTDLSQDPATAPTALVSGGTGQDSLTVGNGRDTVLGDKGVAFGAPVNVTVTTADDPETKVNESTSVGLTGVLPVSGNAAPGSPGDDVAGGELDQIAAGLGGSSIYGNNGDDTIGTANDNPQATKVPTPANVAYYRAGPNTIVGGSGSDRIKSGSASDTIYTGSQQVIGEDGVGAGDVATDANTVDTGEGTDTVYGSNAKDYVTTHSTADQTATVYGGGADDVLIGALGTDRLYGGPANDYLVAGPATVSDPSSGTPLVPDQLTPLGGGNARTVTLSAIEPPVSSKLLVGGGGLDRIYGVNGPAEIYGDHTGVLCSRQTLPVSKQPTENPVTTGDPANWDASDLILGGEGIDTVNAGGGADFVKAFGSGDVLCGSGGADEIYGGNGNDLTYAGSGNDKAYGENGNDEIFGNTGDDALYGALNDDRIEGNDGADVASGGLGDDLVIGGTSQAGAPDEGDQLYGDEGTDTVIGDNADSATLPSYPTDLGSADPSLAGTDYVYGGAGDDLAYGGLERDFVYGGTGNDDLEGNGGQDDVYGEAGEDDILGGSSQIPPDSDSGLAAVGRPDTGDLLSGGADDDVIAGDNAILTRTGPTTPITQGRTGVTARGIRLLDLGYSPIAANSGNDTITGGTEPDVILGQGGSDAIHGDAGDDYAEGGPDADTIYGDGGQDDLVGGSHVVQSGLGQAREGQLDAGDTIEGGDAADVVVGDNGQVLRSTGTDSDITKSRGSMSLRLIETYDLADSPHAGTSGNDWLLGQDDPDVLLGQSGNDRITGGAAQDYAEGGPDSDWVEGNAGNDDLVGGSSIIKAGSSGRTAVGQLDAADVVWGGPDDDLVLGDNAVVSRAGTPDKLTYRIGTNPTGSRTDGRALQLLDLNGPINTGTTPAAPVGRSGGDYLSGQDGVDVLLGQDGGDQISGGSADDYVEGQGAADTVYGDDDLTGVPTPAGLLGTPTAGYADDAGADGQDELIGGKSEAGFRDSGDTIYGNGASDFVLGDNGTAVRDTTGPVNALVDRVYALRYASPAPAGAAKIRLADASVSPSTRFCGTGTTCERTGSYGDDQLFGQAGDDFLYGQDGNDTIRGGTQDDDIYGELGDDRLFGDEGEDAILGDRGGIKDRYESAANQPLLTVTQVPKVEYQQAQQGTVTRVVDLLHDANGDALVGAGNGSRMPHNGLDEGGNDRIRGGEDNDSIHAGFGEDLANGDSGGDALFGDDGADVLWGGRGCDATIDKDVVGAKRPYCYVNHVFDPAPHKANGETIQDVTDYLIGGVGGLTALSDTVQRADILDWRPRVNFDPKKGPSCTADQWPKDIESGTKKAPVTITIDPCSWLDMTNTTDDTAPITKSDVANGTKTQAEYDAYIATTVDNQHHDGVDWQYGGWDRDVMQGDVADNGPNEGDRLLDWTGTYNLYTHCNAAYGGYNDVRTHSPAWQDFLQKWVYSEGAGQALSDVQVATTPPTSAYRELALVYPGETAHGSGSAFPSTPGHFDNPNACAL